MNYMYLLDANVLADSTVMSYIDTDFFRERCIVLGEIAYELQDTSYHSKIKPLVATFEPKILECLLQITDELIRLGILQTNHGNGDALLIAAGMYINSGATDRQTTLDFMRQTAVVVTDEKAVDIFAKSRGVSAISKKEFIEIVRHL